MMVDPSAYPAPTPFETERRRGYRQGMNQALAFLIVLSTVWVEFRTLKDVPEYHRIFAELKVPLPAVTVLVLRHYNSMGLIFGLFAGLCMTATCIRGDRQAVLMLNIAAFILLTGWMYLLLTAFHPPLMSLLEGVTRRR